MEQLLRKSTIQMTGYAIDKQEEYPISSEYTLPEYCPDVAVVLKCFADPRIQNRQWSNNQLLLDGNVIIRVLYLDEERKCVRSLEFAQPFACSLQSGGQINHAALVLDLQTKYLNCRALSPRRIEVRGAITVKAQAEGTTGTTVVTATDEEGLHTRTEAVIFTIPVRACDKVISVSDALEFDSTLPAAEMLLGGECRATIHECKLLPGKAIIKGHIYIHQLYTDDTSAMQTHCLDYTLPFSQIMDVDEAREGMPYKASVQILSDVERCSVGPDGKNTILDVTVKLLLQVQVYQKQEVTLLKDAFHSRYPVTVQTEEIELISLLSTRWESTVLPMQFAMPNGKWEEIVDIIVQPQSAIAQCGDGRASIKGRMAVCVVARDTDGEVVYHEFTEEYAIEQHCNGNMLQVKPVVTALNYRVVGDKLELQIKLCICISEYRSEKKQRICDLSLQRETPYPHQNVSALLYYAESGETVWEIGRRCHASPACILEENDMTDECIRDNTVIIVPICG